MDTVIIKNSNVVLSESIAEQMDVVIRDGVIDTVSESGKISPAEGATVIDGWGSYLAPGFIDLHFHGMLQYLVDKGPEDLLQICTELPRFGVTGFLPTVAPLPEGVDAEFVKKLAGVKSPATAILGFFLEGPFLSLTGALPPEALGSASENRIRNLKEAASPYPAIFAVAPDLDGIIDFIPMMAEGNTPVFITHTAATVEQTLAGIEAGISHATHFYDVFPCPEMTESGRRPAGAVEAIMSKPKVTVDFILDGEHVHPVVAKMALACKGHDKVCLITDANLGAALPPGTYRGIGGSDVGFAYPGAPARMTGNDRHPGGLVGSGLTMDRAVRNAVKMLDIDLPLAVKMASINPARVLGLAAGKGKIEPGYDADLVLLDKDLEVIRTFVGGKNIYSRDI
jgi:N-acetylglucosamine-6-phosphate deacetylase